MGCGSWAAMTTTDAGKKDANFLVKSLTSSSLSGIVRALAARYGLPVSGRAFENGVVKRSETAFCYLLQTEMQSVSRAIKSLKTKEKHRRLVFFVI